MPVARQQFWIMTSGHYTELKRPRRPASPHGGDIFHRRRHGPTPTRGGLSLGTPRHPRLHHRMIDPKQLLDAALTRDWEPLAQATGLPATRLARLALEAIDNPQVAARYPVQCRILADRRAHNRQARDAAQIDKLAAN